MARGQPRRFSLVFWAALAVTVYALVSMALAVATADRCGELDAGKRWQVIPPMWECTAGG